MSHHNPRTTIGAPGWRGVALLLAVLVAVIAVLPAPTQAGWFGKKKKQETEKKQPQRFEKYPDMRYLVGTLTRGGRGGWQVNGVDVAIEESTNVTTQTESYSRYSPLREGREVILMGSQYGRQMVVRQAIVLKPDMQLPSYNSAEKIVWSESDPTVGVGTGPM